MKRVLPLFPAWLFMVQPILAFNASYYNVTGPKLFWNLTNPPPDISTNLINPATKAVRFFLATDAYSEANLTNELNALRASFAQWQSIPGATVKFEEAGLILPQVDMMDAQDNTNIVYWVKYTNIVNKGRANITGALGFTVRGFRSDGNITGTDIMLNGRYFSWFTDFNSKADPNYFVEGTALHEIGHALGLAHASTGGATMLARGRPGIDSQTGLSADEVAFARTVYPYGPIMPSLSQLRGQVSKNGSPVFGAAIMLEDADGNLLGSTVSRTDGTYQMPALPAGTHKVRVCPLDPANASSWLIRGVDVDTASIFSTVDTSFLPTTNVSVTLAGGVTNTLNVAVTGGTPAFRITWIRNAVTDLFSYSLRGVPTLLYPGQSNRIMGVFSPDLPASGATVAITGDGVTIGAPWYDPGDVFAGLNGISWVVSVASNATPGLRTIMITQGTNFACANGYLEIAPNSPDYNFDGLDDNFQRAYFPRFTDPEAAPNADPDGDGVSNAFEYLAGTVPTDANSVFKIDTVTQTTSGTTVAWRSVAGRSYQLFSRSQFDVANWQTVTDPVMATNSVTQLLDTSATNGMRFYRVQVLP